MSRNSSLTVQNLVKAETKKARTLIGVIDWLSKESNHVWVYVYKKNYITSIDIEDILMTDNLKKKLKIE